jgi:hypothetical protein
LSNNPTSSPPASEASAADVSWIVARIESYGRRCTICTPSNKGQRTLQRHFRNNRYPSSRHRSVTVSILIVMFFVSRVVFPWLCFIQHLCPYLSQYYTSLSRGWAFGLLRGLRFILRIALGIIWFWKSSD